MAVLLDTHAFLWWVQNDSKLSRKARREISRAECYFSLASCWELAIKASLSRTALIGRSRNLSRCDRHPGMRKNSRPFRSVDKHRRLNNEPPWPRGLLLHVLPTPSAQRESPRISRFRLQSVQYAHMGSLASSHTLSQDHSTPDIPVKWDTSAEPWRSQRRGAYIGRAIIK